jgi:hypothetical protein
MSAPSAAHHVGQAVCIGRWLGRSNCAVGAPRVIRAARPVAGARLLPILNNPNSSGTSTSGGRLLGLSEQERRIFAEIEQQLTEDDPRFVHKTRRVTVEARRGRRIRLAIAAIVVGFLSLLGIVVSQVFGFIGFGFMFAGVFVGARELQTVEGDFGHRVRELLGRGEDADADADA